MLSRQGFAVVYFPVPIVCVCILRNRNRFTSLPLFWLDVDSKALRPHTTSIIIILSNYLLFLEGRRTPNADIGCEQSEGSQIATVELLLLIPQKSEAVRYARRKALHISRRPNGESFCSLSLFSPPLSELTHTFAAITAGHAQWLWHI